jgi:hypothetical protein
MVRQPKQAGQCMFLPAAVRPGASRPTSKPQTQRPNDYFGVSVALSADGNTLAVGAHLRTATPPATKPTDNSAHNSGAVYVFTRSDSTWSQQAYVKASNTGANDRFGQSVALSGDGSTLAVGAYFEDGNSNLATDSGAVYVFTLSGSTWSQQAYVKASNTGAYDNVRLSA